MKQPDNVADLGLERTKRQPKPNPKRGKINHLDIGEILLEGWRQSNQGVVFTEGQGAWRYFDGLWRLQDDRSLRSWSTPRSSSSAERRGTEAKSQIRLVNETRAWIIRHPDLQIDEAPFDRHGKVPTLSGLPDPVTGEVRRTAARQPVVNLAGAVPEYDPGCRLPLLAAAIGGCLRRPPCGGARRIRSGTGAGVARQGFAGRSPGRRCPASSVLLKAARRRGNWRSSTYWPACLDLAATPRQSTSWTRTTA